jgi:flagellar motor switch protein FliN/FliY
VHLHLLLVHFSGSIILFGMRFAAGSDSVNLEQVLKLEVPVGVLLGERLMRVHEVVGLVPGAIIELSKDSDRELDLTVNGNPIATGTAVKVGENFGIRLRFIGSAADRLNAATKAAEAASQDENDAAALAEQLLSGQM